MKKFKIKFSPGWRKSAKIFSVSVLAIVLMLSLTGCGSTSTSTPTNLVVWGFVDPDVFTPIIKDFENQNKGITVTYQKKTLDSNYENAALNSILSGQGPDVWAIPNDWVYRHKDQLYAVPSSQLTSAKLTPTDYFPDFVMSDNSFNNQLYGMPATTDVLQAYYNPAIFDAAGAKVQAAYKSGGDQAQTLNRILQNFPVTWNEFDQIIPWLTTKTGSTINVAGAALGTSGNVSDSADILSLLMLQNQTKMLSDDMTSATFNLPIKSSSGADVYAGKNSIDFYSKYADPSNADYTWNSSMPNDVQAFVQGKVGIIFGYSSLANYISQIYPNFTFRRADMPQVGDLNNIVDYAKYTSYVVPSNSPLKDTAWQFIINLATNDSSTYKSATKELINKKQSGVDSGLKTRVGSTPNDNLVSDATSFIKGRYPVDFDSQLNQAIDRVVSHAQDSQTSLDTAAANVTNLLRQSTW